KFASMRQMMVQLGASTGLMGKIPGFKQFSQMKRLANMDINALMGAGGGDMGGLPLAGAGGGMPNMPAMPGVPTGNLPGMPKGYTPPGWRTASAGTSRPSNKKKQRDRRRAERAARKRGRKRCLAPPGSLRGARPPRRELGRAHQLGVVRDPPHRVVAELQL